jgi:alkanesulfonate monooxygenase SsuD/methylene tetrahydromethanopterin reductase-like flavin-dependent oxidoreductase (luciferase family)
MHREVDRGVLDQWLAVGDDAFSSVVIGERIEFRNLEVWSAAAAAATLTRRCRVLVGASILTAHPPTLVAKQAASVDVLSEGRLVLAVGTGVRPDDLAALGAGEAGPAALADAAGEVRRRWASAPDDDTCGPVPVQVHGPPLLAAVIGPRAIRGAAGWADGVYGFSVTGDVEALGDIARRARAAWAESGGEAPHLVAGTFCSVGTDDDRATLRAHLVDYLGGLGRGVAFGLAKQAEVAGADAVHAHLDALAEAGFDEAVLVAASADPSMADALAALVADHG